MIFVRTGPRFLFLRSGDTDGLRELLITKFDGITVSFNQAIGTSGEYDTIVLITPQDALKSNVANAKYIIVIPLGSSVVLTKLINLNLGNMVTRAELGAGLLVQRLPQGGTGVIDMVKTDYQAKPLSLVEAINIGEPDDTVLAFTHQPLQKAVQVENLIEPSLLINQPIPLMYRKLRREAVRYFTQGLGKSQWYEVRINIYDADEEYDIHARRLELVLEDLEAGLILGESWTRDHALALFSVAAYQIRLFTMIDPLDLKMLLLGMEYNHEGDRFVDMDLYHRRNKIGWASIAKRSPFGRRKSGMQYRNDLLSRLSPKTVEKLLELERKFETT